MRYSDMSIWPKVSLIFIVCGALSAALAAPSSSQLKGAVVACGMSLGCTDSLFTSLILALLGVLSPFVIFIIGAVLVSHTLKVAAMGRHGRLGIAAAFALLPPVILLSYLFS